VFDVTVTGSFAAAHQLRRPDGTAEPLHEHLWNAKVTYAGDVLDEMGLLIDFGPLRQRLGRLLGGLARQNLNELPAFGRVNPSAENVARFLADQLVADVPGAARLVCVEIEEEPGCYARYYPPDEAQLWRPCG